MGFDLLGTVEFKGLVPEANAQILALDNRNDPTVPLGEVNFFLAQGAALITENEFELTRDIDALVGNEAPATLTEVLLDQLEILTTGPQLNTRTSGRVSAAEELMFLFAPDVNAPGQVELPFMVSSLER